MPISALSAWVWVSRVSGPVDRVSREVGVPGPEGDSSKRLLLRLAFDKPGAHGQLNPRVLCTAIDEGRKTAEEYGGQSTFLIQ